MQNYFSIGSDAYTALRFHTARERHPEKFDSRIRNKMYYGVFGAKEMIQKKFKNLSSDIELVCDGVSYSDFIRRKKIEAVCVLNLSNYAGGTRPWGTKLPVDKFLSPSIGDGLLEVVGFESAWSMAKQQIGVTHAVRICQVPCFYDVTNSSTMTSLTPIYYDVTNPATMTSHTPPL